LAELWSRIRKHAKAIPSPRGRIALLACEQRHICVSRIHIPLNRHRRKQLPSTIQTTGDYIQAKRYEKGLHPYQLASKMGIAASLVSAWERGTETPDEKQWQMLSNLLSFDSGVNFPKPHR
jgi:ribosome-binding protein aMBF1 (putative translation factor)